MSKGKPRWYPNKPQNKYGGICPMVEEIPQKDGTIYMRCEHICGRPEEIKVCKGNKHNCVKTYLHREASKSDARKNNEFRRTKNEKNQQI